MPTDTLTNSELAEQLIAQTETWQTFNTEAIRWLTSTNDTEDLYNPVLDTNTTVTTIFKITEDYEATLNGAASSLAVVSQILDDAQALQQNVITIEASVANYDTTFQGYLSQAAQDAVDCNDSAIAAAASALAAASSASSADTSALEALGFRDEAQTARTQAQTAKTDAESEAANALTSRNEALASEQKAEAWAETALDVEVEVGKFSALHHAAKAEEFSNEASDYATSANANAYSAYLDAFTASTKANEAKTSAADASISETNAATSEGNASADALAAASSATTAANEATDASASASSAATSASDAATSASDAAASAASFNIVYSVCRYRGNMDSTSIANTEVDLTGWTNLKTNSDVTRFGGSFILNNSGYYKVALRVNTLNTNRTELILRTYEDNVLNANEVSYNYVSRDIDQANGTGYLFVEGYYNSGDILKFSAEGNSDDTCVMKTAGTHITIERVEA